MGQNYDPHRFRRSIVSEISKFQHDVEFTIDRWEDSLRSGKMESPEIYLNDTMAMDGLARMRKLLRELNGKIDDSIAGVYRPRPKERRPGRPSRPRQQGTTSTEGTNSEAE